MKASRFTPSKERSYEWKDFRSLFDGRRRNFQSSRVGKTMCRDDFVGKSKWKQTSMKRVIYVSVMLARGKRKDLVSDDVCQLPYVRCSRGQWNDSATLFLRKDVGRMHLSNHNAETVPTSHEILCFDICFRRRRTSTVSATNLEGHYCTKMAAGFAYQIMSERTSTMTIPIQLEHTNCGLLTHYRLSTYGVKAFVRRLCAFPCCNAILQFLQWTTTKTASSWYPSNNCHTQ